ncbi:uncharacterized protein C8Q71DRAFT_291271 [Rhodofomes roseus]|uniref:J domain-containing protein n=1 Tax=Rhodofomes roseus TaxID=34475 RepID=A0ABQ8K556_9APHY|nr:uncharacterized protein C8Q71DRAFT_291271 [Rhodofomes roseus]KAH9831553.1 hypothetical protein C8Q71DRAFT_291271 [Rhodofomes roseus]
MPVAIPSRRYFSALELEPDHVGEEEIRAAYKRLALKWHPDRHANDKDEAQQKFIEVNEAYTVLLEYYQHRKRGSPHPEKRPRQEHSRPAPDAGASPHEHRSEDAQSSHSRTHNESDAHSTRSSSHTSYTTPPSSPKSSTRNKLHKDRPRQDDASDAGRHSTSSRSDLRDDARSSRHSQSHSKERSDVRPSPSTPDDHTRTERRTKDEGRRQHSSRSKDNLRAQSPSRQNKDAHPHSPHSPTHPHHSAEAYFTWPRKRQTRQRSDDSTTSQRRPGFFPKRSKLDLDPPPVDADSTAGADVIDYDFINLGTPIPPLRSPHHPSDHPRRDKDWTFPLRLTLDDLYHARAHHYRITRTLRSGATESVKIPIPVDPAWRTGTRVLVPGMGNERADGSFQDIVFVVEQEHHPRFMRQGADLVAAVQVPWEERPPGAGDADHAYVLGMDGEEFALPIPRTLSEGADGTRIVGAGMPVIKGGRMVGKGDLLVRWEFIFNEGEYAQPSRWQNLRKVMGWRP